MVVQRGECTFVDKARKAQAAEAAAVIVIDNVVGSSSSDLPMFAMSGDGKDGVTIPVVFLFHNDSKILAAAIQNNTELQVSICLLLFGKFTGCFFIKFSIIQLLTRKMKQTKIV